MGFWEILTLVLIGGEIEKKWRIVERTTEGRHRPGLGTRRHRG